MAQHFLLSSQRPGQSVWRRVLRMSDQEAYDAFKAIRFSENRGEAFAPRAAPLMYNLPRRKMWRCKTCPCQFSVTSGTIFSSRKLAIRDILAAIAISRTARRAYRASIEPRSRRAVQDRFRPGAQTARSHCRPGQGREGIGRSGNRRHVCGRICEAGTI